MLFPDNTFTHSKQLYNTLLKNNHHYNDVSIDNLCSLKIKKSVYTTNNINYYNSLSRFIKYTDKININDTKYV